ncbi:Recombination endonuclease VII [Blastococcus sp. DSM 46786]|nr:Recombination endonuclease VII [Blastococcus sp. DSM 46786]
MGRRCTDCRRYLAEDRYYFVSKASGKLRGQCKDCMRQRKLEQRDPAWAPSCSRCGTRLSERAGSGRRLRIQCFAETYDVSDPRTNGAHRIKLKPCSLCGGRKERFERGKVCRPCRPWLRYAASLRQYGLTPAEYVAIFNAQGGRCYVCGVPPQTVRLCIDHDHSISDMRQSIRGLLCSECNYSRLPRFQDNAEMLERAASYLIDPPAQSVFATMPVGMPTPPPPEGVVFFPQASVGDDHRPEDGAPWPAGWRDQPTRRAAGRVADDVRDHVRAARRTSRQRSGARRREQAGEADG